MVSFVTELVCFSICWYNNERGWNFLTILRRTEFFHVSWIHNVVRNCELLASLWVCLEKFPSVNLFLNLKWLLYWKSCSNDPLFQYGKLTGFHHSMVILFEYLCRKVIWWDVGFVVVLYTIKGSLFSSSVM